MYAKRLFCVYTRYFLIIKLVKKKKATVEFCKYFELYRLTFVK